MDYDSDDEIKGYVTETGRFFEIKEWQISVTTKSFDACFTEERVAPLAKIISTRKGVGGAPTKYEWSRAAGYAAAYVVENSYVKGQTDLVERLQEWFVTSGGGRSPDRRDVERFVSEMFAVAPAMEKARRKT